MVAEAQTGSGKTAAFGLPLVAALAATAPLPTRDARALVLAPTRELALQVAATFKLLARDAPWPLRVLAVIGGEPVGDQIAGLQAGVDIVVATPGRLLDLLAQGAIALAGVRFLVLDEADRLLDADFAAELDGLLAALPARRQTLLFSATLPPAVLRLRDRVLRDPVDVRIDAAPLPVAAIVQRVFEVDAHRRRALLQHLLAQERWGQVLVFVATQTGAENLATKLRAARFKAAALHGGLTQDERVAVLRRFKNGAVAVLVATDLAARGIDVPLLGAVVNFDLPRSPRDYLHRVGRTGRAGAAGIAASFVDGDSEPHLRIIEAQNQLCLPREQVPGFEPTVAPRGQRQGGAPQKGRRQSKKDKLRAAAALDLPPAEEAAALDSPQPEAAAPPTDSDPLSSR